MALMASADSADQATRPAGIVVSEASRIVVSMHAWVMPALMPRSRCSHSVTMPVPPTPAP